VLLTLPDNCRRLLNRAFACPARITYNLRHIQTSPESYIFHPRCNFLFLLLHIHHLRTSFTISGLTTRAAIDFSSSSQLCPRANQDGPAPLRSLTLPHTSAVFASQSLSKSPSNRHTGPSLLHPRCDHVYTLVSSCSHQSSTRLIPVAFHMLLIYLSTSGPAACVAP